ncbi:hypothetical protein ACFX13_013858 [Malus domestica]
MLHFVEDNSNSVSIFILNICTFRVLSFFYTYLLFSFPSPPPAQESHPPPVIAFGKPIVPEIPMVSEATHPKASQVAAQVNLPTSSQVTTTTEASGEGSGIIPHSQVSENDPPQPLRESTPHPPLSKASSSIQGLREDSGQSPLPLVPKADLPSLL